MIERFKKLLAKWLKKELLQYVKQKELMPPTIETIDCFDFTRYRSHGNISDLRLFENPNLSNHDIEECKTALLDHIRKEIVIYRRDDYRIGACEIVAEIVIGKKRI